MMRDQVTPPHLTYVSLSSVRPNGTPCRGAWALPRPVIPVPQPSSEAARQRLCRRTDGSVRASHGRRRSRCVEGSVPGRLRPRHREEGVGSWSGEAEQRTPFSASVTAVARCSPVPTSRPRGRRRHRCRSRAGPAHHRTGGVGPGGRAPTCRQPEEPPAGAGGSGGSTGSQATEKVLLPETWEKLSCWCSCCRTRGSGCRPRRTWRCRRRWSAPW